SDARPGPAHGGGDQAGHLAGCAAALFFILVDDDPAEPGGDRLGGRGDQVVPAVPGQGDRGHRLAAPDVGDHAPGRVERGSVVAVVHDHRAAPGQVDVAPARVELFGGERGKRAPDVLGAHPGGTAGRYCAERIGQQVPCEPAKRARQLGDAEQHPLPGRLDLHDLAVAELVGDPAGLPVPVDNLAAHVQAEEPDHRGVPAHARTVGDRGGGRIVGVEHHRGAVVDLLRDQRLDVDQLVEVVDAVGAQVIGLDVGDHSDV